MCVCVYACGFCFCPPFQDIRLNAFVVQEDIFKLWVWNSLSPGITRNTIKFKKTKNGVIIFLKNGLLVVYYGMHIMTTGFDWKTPEKLTNNPGN